MPLDPEKLRERSKNLLEFTLKYPTDVDVTAFKAASMVLQGIADACITSCVGASDLVKGAMVDILDRDYKRGFNDAMAGRDFLDPSLCDAYREGYMKGFEQKTSLAKDKP